MFVVTWLSQEGHAMNKCVFKGQHGYGWTERRRFRGIPIEIWIDHILNRKGHVLLLCEVGPGSDHLQLIEDVEY